MSHAISFESFESFDPDMRGAPLVGEIMTTSGALVPSRIRMDAARRIAALKNVRHLFVEDEGRLAGMLDSAALDHAADGDRVTAHVRAVPRLLTPTTSVPRALEAMRLAGVTGLPVVSGRFLIGLVTRGALSQAVKAWPGRRSRATVAAPAAMGIAG